MSNITEMPPGKHTFKSEVRKNVHAKKKNGRKMAKIPGLVKIRLAARENP